MRLGTRSLGMLAAAGLLLGNLGRVPGLSLGGRAAALTFLDAVLIPLWLTLVITLARGGRRWRLDAFATWGIAFVGIALVSTVLAGPKWGLSLGAHLGVAAFLVRWVLYAGWYLLVVTDPEPDEAGRRLWASLDTAIVAFLIFGLLQSALLPNFGRLTALYTGLEWDVQGRRLVSTVLDPNFSGGLLLIGLVMRLAQEAYGIRTNRLTLALFAIGLVLTLSRASWLALAAVLPLALLVRGLRGYLPRLLAVGSVAVVAAVPAIVAYGREYNKFEVDVSGLMRFIPWLRSVVLIRDNPVFGVGFNAAGPAQTAYGWELMGGASVSMDGGLLFVAVMTGLAGAVAYSGMLWTFFAAARRTWRAADIPVERRAFALGGVMATVGILVQSLFGNGLLIPWLALPLWVLQARVVATAPAAVPRARPMFARVPTVTAALALLLAVGGCDPCAGVAECTGASERVVAGNIVDAESQRPTAGVRVRAGTLDSTLTNANGRWELRIPGAVDTAIAIRVESPGQAPYVVPNVLVRATRTVGDATQVGLWYDRPVVSYVAGVRRGTALVSGVAVEFTADSASGGFVYSDTSRDGFVRLTGPANTVGTITGRLRLQGGGLGTLVYPTATIGGEYRVQPDFIRGYFDVEREYRYGGNIQNRGNGVKTTGATVRWTRTGGLLATPSMVTTTSVGDGFFIFGVRLVGLGESIGNLTITPPSGPSFTYTGFRLSTYDGNDARYVGLLGHGEAWWYRLFLRRAADSSAVAWTPYRFTRTSGLTITPNSFTGTTDGEGFLWLNASVTGSGTVTGVLELLPPGQPVITVGTFTLQTNASDVPPLLPTRYIP